MIGAREFVLRSREYARGRIAALDARRRGKPVLHFIHLGKTGGTAIKHALSGQENAGRFRIVLHEHDFTLGMVPKGEFAFFVLRDPVERYVSSFASRQKQGLPRYHYPWSRGEKAAFSRFASAEDLALALGSSDKAERGAAERAMRTIRHVRDSYARMLGDLAQICSREDRIAFVGFQHRLDDDFARFRSLADLPSSIGLPTGTVEAHRAQDSGTKAPLLRPAIDNLKSWYAQDLAIYAALRQAHEPLTDGQPVASMADRHENLHG